MYPEKGRINKKKFTLFLLGFIILTAIIFNSLWIIYDQSPPLWDMAAHSARSVTFGDFIRGLHIKSIFNYPTIYPPATYLFTGSLYLIFGSKEDIPQFSLLIYLIIFLISVYGLAQKIFKKNKVTLLSVFLVLIYPELVHFTRIYDLDFPLTALVTFYIFALLKTNNFSSRKWSIILGFTVGWGVLTKWTFWIFFIGPFLFYFLAYEPFGKKIISRAKKINFLIFLLISILLIAPWYFQHHLRIIFTAFLARYNVFSVPYENLFSFNNVIYYPTTIWRGMGWPLAVLAILALIFYVFQRKKESWLLIIWILIPYFILTFLFYSKESRYFLPIYPALAIITAGAIFSLKNNRFRKLLLFLTITLGIFFWVETSWKIDFFSSAVYPRLGLNGSYGFFNTNYGFTYPTQYHLNIKEIPRAISEDKQERGLESEESQIIVIPNSIFLSAAPIEFYGNLIGLKADYSLSSQIRTDDYFRFIKQADYLVAKTGDQGPRVFFPKIDLNKIEKELEKSNSQIFKKFKLIKSWTLNGIEQGMTEARLYRNIE